jgi:membrane associated rhomboid family serine protease
MKQRPLVTIVLILLCLLVTFLIPALDSSIYGFNGHPTYWLSFSPADPLRVRGLAIILSPFIHLDAAHLLVNLVLLVPLALVVERRRSGARLLFVLMLLHLGTLLGLTGLAALVPIGAKAFLGSSHVVTGLYTYWGLGEEKYAYLYVPIGALVLGAGQGQDQLTIFAHAVALAPAVLLVLSDRLRRKLRPKGAH